MSECERDMEGLRFKAFEAKEEKEFVTRGENICVPNYLSKYNYLIFPKLLVTFGVALVIPSLGLLISLIGAVCSNSLALLFPVIIEFLNETRGDKRMSVKSGLKNGFVLVLFLIGFASGAFESVRSIIDIYQD